jgi:hypothetical protein
MRPAFFLGAALVFFPALVYAYTRKSSGGGVLDGIQPGDALPPPFEAFDPSVLSEPTFLESIGVSDMHNTRGERNNNPGNIRISAANWKGKVAGSDAAFETFANPQDGIRAMSKLLRTYQTKYNLRTVRQLVTRWAPAAENNTESYIRSVAGAMGVGPDDAVSLADDAVLSAMVSAIITHENGRNIYASADIAAGVEAA